MFYYVAQAEVRRATLCSLNTYGNLKTTGLDSQVILVHFILFFLPVSIVKYVKEMCGLQYY